MSEFGSNYQPEPSDTFSASDEPMPSLSDLTGQKINNGEINSHYIVHDKMTSFKSSAGLTYGQPQETLEAAEEIRKNLIDGTSNHKQKEDRSRFLEVVFMDKGTRYNPIGGALIEEGDGLFRLMSPAHGETDGFHEDNNRVIFPVLDNEG